MCVSLMYSREFPRGGGGEELSISLQTKNLYSWDKQKTIKWENHQNATPYAVGLNGQVVHLSRPRPSAGGPGQVECRWSWAGLGPSASLRLV